MVCMGHTTTSAPSLLTLAATKSSAGDSGLLITVYGTSGRSASWRGSLISIETSAILAAAAIRLAP
ncbi:hypothetical protein SRABI26_03822 [Arthrobacter sp. Bi26]|nr:hypothetical protein SRABI26_03822 [Arthrobacter sp. Bi26]